VLVIQVHYFSGLQPRLTCRFRTRYSADPRGVKVNSRLALPMSVLLPEEKTCTVFDTLLASTTGLKLDVISIAASRLVHCKIINTEQLLSAMKMGAALHCSSTWHHNGVGTQPL
jgi:hypothetical protein